jgi:DNA (cytosine-5)-methyltransferase 1
MRYVSVFSGVEAASLAFEPLGWEPVCFCEVDEFPSQVLRKRFTRVPNLGDIRDVKWKEVLREWGPVDLVVGGSPCQSFSIAGNRTGLEGESGLMWEYVRCVREIMPRWLLWENVPGALSSSNGEDFRCLLESLDDLGYGLAWRVLDAQFFGVAQRRRRVFVVGSLGDRRACEVLFEPDSLRWDPPTSREKRAELARGAGIRAKAAGFKFSAGSTGYGEGLNPTLTVDHNPAILTPWDVQSKRIYAADGVAPTLQSGGGEGANIQPIVFGIAGDIENRKPENGGNGAGWCDPNENGMYTLTATDRHAVCMTDTQSGASVSEETSGALTCHSAKDAPVVAFAQNTRDEVRLQNGDGSIAGALSANPGMKQTTYIADGYVLRRLTPLECERLQGFPDGWTDVEYKGKPAPDTLRYKAIGNSMAVSVMKWIGERIERFDQGGAR